MCKKYILLFRCRLFRGRKLCIELSGISLFYDNAPRQGTIFHRILFSKLDVENEDTVQRLKVTHVFYVRGLSIVSQIKYLIARVFKHGSL